MRAPSGPGEPPAVQLLRWIRDPFGLLDRCQARYGDAFSLRVPGQTAPFVVVAAPEAVKEVFALDADVGHAGKANVVLKPLLGKHSVILLDGAQHARQRKMMMPAFHGERMSAYGRTMMTLAHDAIDRLPVSTRTGIYRPMQSITLGVIVRTVFGLDAGPRFAQLTAILTKTIDAAARPFLLLPVMQRDLGPLSPWGRFMRLGARASEMLRHEIRRGRDHGTAGRTDVLAMLLEARDEAGAALSEDEVHDQLVTLLVAGHETTATALAWTLRWLWTDAALVDRVRDEIASAGGDPQAIARLALLDATVREGLRLQPVVPLVGRVLQKPTRIAGYDLEPGAAVAPSIYLVHRRPSLYPEPSRFRPDRFLAFKPAPWEWLPFGGGLRRCIGAAFAMFEMKMVLAALLPRVDARLAVDQVPLMRRGVTLTPKGGLPIVITARRSRAACAQCSARTASTRGPR
jgi:cytochrome P450